MLRQTLIVTATAAWVTGTLAVSAAHANGLEPPSGRVLLTVTGNIAHTNDGDAARFDRDMLEALGTETLHTSTAWTEGVNEFEGVLARDLFDAVGAEGEEVLTTALNDYIVTIPFSDFEDYPVLLALEMDGERLHIRDKGPIWIVYPRDQYPELQNSSTDKKWNWQLSEMHVQ